MVNLVFTKISFNGKIVAIISSIILVVVFYVSVSSFWGKEDNFGLYLDKDVYIVGERVIMTVWNDSPYTITYGYDYRFQIEIDGEWVNITDDVFQNNALNSTGMGVEAVVHSSERRAEVIDISKLNVGNYVFIQEIRQHKPQKVPPEVVHTFIEEFEIKQN